MRKGTSVGGYGKDVDKESMATRLINRGANINYVNYNGKTPLHIFIENKMI